MHVLILGTMRSCHERLQAHGHTATLLVAKDKTKGVDLNGFYQNVVVLDKGASDAEWLGIATVFHQAQPFDAVIAFNDGEQQRAHLIAQALGIFCTVDPVLSALVSNKSAMREALVRQGIPSCRYAYARGEQELRGAIDQVGMPCIVKPVAGEASVGVARIGSSDDIAAAMRHVGEQAIAAGVIVEEFLVGDEYSVEAITSQGQHHILAITKKFKDASTFVEIGHLVPAPLEADTSAAIRDYVHAVLGAFNYRDCPSHTELVLTADGPRIIETHTRVGGDRIVELVRHACGTDLYDLVARQGTGQDLAEHLPQQIVYHQSAAVWFAHPEAAPHQQLAEIKGADAAGSHDYVKRLDLLKKIGSAGGKVLSSFDRGASTVVVGASASEALARGQSIIASLQFLYSAAPVAPAA
jgi:biotin carboxylase